MKVTIKYKEHEPDWVGIKTDHWGSVERIWMTEEKVFFTWGASNEVIPRDVIAELFIFDDELR